MTFHYIQEQTDKKSGFKLSGYFNFGWQTTESKDHLDFS